MRLEGKVTIITGGGSGMGRVAAQLFAGQGAKSRRRRVQRGRGR